MKRSTAIGHLVEMADVASQRLELGDRRRWPLSGMWVTGELLTLAETLDAGAVVLVLQWHIYCQVGPLTGTSQWRYPLFEGSRPGWSC